MTGEYNQSDPVVGAPGDARQSRNPYHGRMAYDLASEIDPKLAAALVDVREALAQVVGVAMGDVEDHPLVAGSLQGGVDRAGHDVAGRALGQRVDVLHERLTRSRV